MLWRDNINITTFVHGEKRIILCKCIVQNLSHAYLINIPVRKVALSYGKEYTQFQ